MAYSVNRIIDYVAFDSSQSDDESKTFKFKKLLDSTMTQDPWKPAFFKDLRIRIDAAGTWQVYFFYNSKWETFKHDFEIGFYFYDQFHNDTPAEDADHLFSLAVDPFPISCTKGWDIQPKLYFPTYTKIIDNFKDSKSCKVMTWTDQVENCDR